MGSSIYIFRIFKRDKDSNNIVVCLALGRCALQTLKKKIATYIMFKAQNIGVVYN